MAVRQGIAGLRPGCRLLGGPSCRREGPRASSGHCPHPACTRPVAPQDEAGLTTTFQTWPRGWFHIPKDPDFPVPS